MMAYDFDKYIKLAREIVLGVLEGEDINVFLFGSRADGTNREMSDIDIGFSGFTSSPEPVMRKVRIALEESRVPYHFDLVNFDISEENFKQIAKENIVPWN